MEDPKVLAEPNAAPNAQSVPRRRRRIVHVDPISPLTGTRKTELPQYYDPAEMAARAANRPEPSGIQIVTDEWTNHLLRVGEDEDPDTMNYFDATVEMVREPGMSYRYLNPDVVGGYSGKGFRGWQPVYDDEGKQVTVAGQMLGKMPTERARARQIKRSNMARQQAQAHSESASEQAERITREAGGLVRVMSPHEAESMTGLSGGPGRR